MPPQTHSPWTHTLPPTRGAALERVTSIQPQAYARTRNHLQGAVTGLSPYLTHGLLTLPEVLAQVKTQQPIGIIVAQHHDPKPARWLATSMGVQSRLLILPATVTDEQPGAIVRWLDQVLTQLSSLAK